MESELSVLIIFNFEERPCLILDSKFQSCFHNSDSEFHLQIPHFRAARVLQKYIDYIWIEQSEPGWIELNKYNKKEFNKMRTKLTTE